MIDVTKVTTNNDKRANQEFILCEGMMSAAMALSRNNFAVRAFKR
jgi:hypothetical protein